MDVDYIAGEQAIEKIKKSLSDVPHGKRENIADEIIEFADKLEKKYKKEQFICNIFITLSYN